jgi:uncharacterized repeat protein (TIGR01451 family)
MRRIVIATVSSLLALAAVPALATAEGGAQWTVTSVSRATNFRPGDETGDDSYLVTVTNTGAAASDGEPVEVTDELPEGLTLDPAGASSERWFAGQEGLSANAGFSCAARTCTYDGVVPPDETLTFVFPVDVASAKQLKELPEPTCPVPAEAVSCLTNVVRISGAGAPDASVSTPTAISDSPAGFGIAPGGASTALSSTQAGAHPDLSTSIAFNTVEAQGALAGDPKDTTDDLPPGFAGDLVDTPACPIAVLSKRECPVPTQVGVVTLVIAPLSRNGPAGRFVEPLYNVAPNPGAAAKLGFSVGGIFAVQGSVTVRPGDYGLRTTFENVDESLAELDSVSLTLWGVPGAAIHDRLRWNGGRADEPGSEGGHFGAPAGTAAAPFFTNPTACTVEPLQAQFTLTSWEHPGESESPQPTAMAFGPLTGCDRLGMDPSLTAETTTDSAYAPTGFDLDTTIPQTYENAEGLATSTLKKEVVTLPEGITVNPSSGAGLAACSESQYAEEGVQPRTAEEQAQGHGCPSASKLATVRIKTPSLAEEVIGSVYLATPAPRGASEPGNNPFNSLLALYLIARAPDRGVLIGAPGLVQANESTGRLTTTFDDLPPLPFSVAKFEFNQGANAPLVTPPQCGNYTVTAELTPWSNTEGSPIDPEIQPFPIDANCPSGGVPPFNPQVTAGTLNNAAGSYSPLDIRITRNDGEQEITGFATQLPAGLTGNLSGVQECSEAQIEAARHRSGTEEEADPSCPAGSQIGHSIAEAGVGSVLAQAPGKIYLGGPYEGAPFSVVAITSAHVGPFDLGTVVIHFPLEINPETAAVSIPAGQADQIPRIIKGIVIHLRTIRAYIDRNDFMINPTNCAPVTLNATVIGGGAGGGGLDTPADNDPVTVTNPFQAADCAGLKFAPKFAASTSGKTSRSNGASLSVKLTYPTGSLGSDANIQYVKVDLPKQLPSRLTTLQKACTAAQFDANPAGCPTASLIGTARAVTPILPVALEGPVYFVSHASEKFPSLEIVLQGDGVTIVLSGETFISHAGITSSTFRTVPDQPVTSFELNLPEGKFSALAANGSLCALTRTVTVKKTVTEKIHGRSKRVVKKTAKTVTGSLQMPTAFVGQNGAEIHQSTPVSVIGCPPTHAKAHRAKSKGKKKPAGGKK